MPARTPILPDFIVIGAMKAATSTLYDLLARHPRIGMSQEKETDFFIEHDYEQKWARYHRQFKPGFELYGEASPNYSKQLMFPMAAPRLTADLPHIRLIYVVRDPVDRLVSHYKHLQHSGDAAPEPEALLGTVVWDRLIDASLYYKQIQAYAPYQEDGRLLVVDFDELSNDPVSTMARIGAYLGVPDGWAALGLDAVESANTGGERARLPQWVLRLNESGAAAQIKRLVPKTLVRQARRAMARGPARETYVPDAHALAVAREAFAPDVAALRALTGMPFASWSV